MSCQVTSARQNHQLACHPMTCQIEHSNSAQTWSSSFRLCVSCLILWFLSSMPQYPHDTTDSKHHDKNETWFILGSFVNLFCLFDMFSDVSNHLLLNTTIFDGSSTSSKCSHRVILYSHETSMISYCDYIQNSLPLVCFQAKCILYLRDGTTFAFLVLGWRRMQNEEIKVRNAFTRLPFWKFSTIKICPLWFIIQW